MMKSNPLTNEVSVDRYGWSFGADLFDVYPVNFEGSFDDLLDFINKHRAPYKGKYYITSPMSPNGYRARGRRCKANALPRQWIAFDMDGELSDSAFIKVKKWFSQFNCIIYETASSKPNARRFRIILFLSRPVIEDEAKIIGGLVERDSGFEGWDSSTYRSAQPVFLPPTEVNLISLEGEPLNVDYWLSKLPPKSKLKYKINRSHSKVGQAVFEWFANNHMVLRVDDAMHEVICPWGHLHSDGRVGAALFEPSNLNNSAWGFKCLHAHCSDRTIKDIYRLMKAVG
jgi:hypothetical protein